MDRPWRPVSELPSGHYAVGLLLHGGEANVFHAGAAMLDTGSGDKVVITAWRPLDVHPFASIKT